MSENPPAPAPAPENDANPGRLTGARDSLKDELAKGTPMSKAIAYSLDELIKIPGTNFRIGLDPILGLIPYGGEAVASIIGCLLLADAGKKGVPFRTLFKMGGNVIVNAAVSTFPVIGDIFSAWFKSNSRNYKMLRQWMDSADGVQAKGGWGPLLIVGGIALFVVALTISMWFALFWLATQLVQTLGSLGA